MTAPGSLLWLSVSAALVSAGAACPTRKTPAATPPGEKRATIVFTADLLGYLEPCGCVADMLGGIARTSHRIETLQNEAGAVLYLDAGDTLHDGSKAEGRRQGQLAAKARTLAGVLTRLEVWTVPGPHDRSLPDYASLLGPRSLLGEKARIATVVYDVGGVSIGVVAVSAKMSAATLVSEVKKARASLDATPQAVVLVVLVAHVGTQTARAAAGELQGVVDAILVGGLVGPSEGDENHAYTGGGVPVFRPMSQGRSLGVLEIRVPAGATGDLVMVEGSGAREAKMKLLASRIDRMLGEIEQSRRDGDHEMAAVRTEKVKRLRARRAVAGAASTRWPVGRAAFDYRFEPITSDWTESGWARDAVAKYDSELSRHNLAWAKANPTPCPAPAQDRAGYAGSVMCTACHAEAAKFWRDTRHAHAWRTLEDEKKQYDLECTSCHVTGWQAPGGVCQLDRVTEAEPERGRPGSLENVQCEACHGPGSLHISASTPQARKATIVREPARSVCRTCHLGDHSPRFVFETYRASIVGPGHGGPPP